MFTNRIASYYSPGKILIEAVALSTDAKPTTGIANGSMCLEMDTGKGYAFNEEDGKWEELPSSGGGGGGGSSDFTTAEVSVIASDYSKYVVVETPIIVELGDEDIPSAYSTYSIEAYGGDVFTVILYKGIALANITSNSAFTVSGGVIEESVAEASHIITGDGTITIS